jgi:hypothetical protein
VAWIWGNSFLDFCIGEGWQTAGVGVCAGPDADSGANGLQAARLALNKTKNIAKNLPCKVEVI